jgi:hypothetical protein
MELRGCGVVCFGLSWLSLGEVKFVEAMHYRSLLLSANSAPTYKPQLLRTCWHRGGESQRRDGHRVHFEAGRYAEGQEHETERRMAVQVGVGV